MGCEAVPRTTPETATAFSADCSPVEDHEVAHGHIGDPFADLTHHSCCLVTQQEWKLIADGPFPIMQVRVADPTCLNIHNDFTRARIGDRDHLDADRLALGLGDYASYLMHHDSPLKILLKVIADSASGFRTELELHP
jgi:hypothetical protein